MEYEDKEISCVDCHETFMFTAGDQEFYEAKGFANPKRCRSCRQLKKDQRAYDEGNATE